MTELRRDLIIGQWVNVHVEDSLGPESYDREDHTSAHKATCPFCPGKEQLTPPEVDAIRQDNSKANAPGWRARVVPNKFPALKIEGTLDETKSGIYDRSNGIGAHEVLIESPDHDKDMADYTVEEIDNVLALYQNRITDLAKDSRFKYIVVFKNYGTSAGTSVEHAHSQIIALPMIPKYVLSKLEGARRYKASHQRCAVCDVLQQEYDDRTRILADNEEFVSFCPFVPRFAFESWIVPKKHGTEFRSMTGNSRMLLSSMLKDMLLRLKNCLFDPSFNFYLITAPVNSGDHLDFHWHIEIVPKLTKTTGFEWGTGFYVVRTSPEKAAEYLRAFK